MMYPSRLSAYSFNPPTGTQSGGATSQGDIMALYQQIMAMMQGQPAPSTNTDQYNQMMKMYQDQQSKMAQMYGQEQHQLGQLSNLYDPSLGKAQMNWMQRMSQEQERQYMRPSPRSTSNNFFGY